MPASSSGANIRLSPERWQYYHLTEAGRNLAPVLVSLFDWGNRWGGPSVEPMARHHDHELHITPGLRCARGGPWLRLTSPERPGVFAWDVNSA